MEELAVPGIPDGVLDAETVWPLLLHPIIAHPARVLEPDVGVLHLHGLVRQVDPEGGLAGWHVAVTSQLHSLPYAAHYHPHHGLSHLQEDAAGPRAAVLDRYQTLRVIV